MSRRSSAIVLSPEAPYPPVGGGALRTASILEYVKDRYDTTVVVFRQPGDADPRPHFPPDIQVEVLELPFHSRAALPRAIRNIRRAVLGRPPLVDRFGGFDDDLERICGGRTFDVGIVEHFWCAEYARVLRPVCRQLVLDLHNVESILLSRQAATVGGVTALLMNRFSASCAELERKWIPAFDLVLTTSTSDAAALGTPSAAAVPNTIMPMPAPCRARDGKIVTMSANFGYQPNQAAVAWFTTTVWPTLRNSHPDARFRLIGKNPECIADSIAGREGIECTGPVQDAVCELARCSVAVVPLLAGSGTRVKIIEAWAAGLPVVTTAVGAEGLPGKAGVHWLQADDPAEFARAVCCVLRKPELAASLGAAGRRLYEQKLTWSAAHDALRAAGL